jgi:hypothetical protein
VHHGDSVTTVLYALLPVCPKGANALLSSMLRVQLTRPAHAGRSPKPEARSPQPEARSLQVQAAFVGLDDLPALWYGHPSEVHLWFGPIAQGLERPAHNRLVLGSNPSGPTGDAIRPPGPAGGAADAAKMIRAGSSVGRASASQAGGRRFKSCSAHHLLLGESRGRVPGDGGAHQPAPPFLSVRRWNRREDE